MRHRASTSLKPGPRHRGTYPFSEARLIATAAILYNWRTTDALPWKLLPYDTQLLWLEEAERTLKRHQVTRPPAHGLEPIAA